MVIVLFYHYYFMSVSLTFTVKYQFVIQVIKRVRVYIMRDGAIGKIDQFLSGIAGGVDGAA